MKKHISMMCAIICYAIGVIASVYFGLWKMLLHPVLMIVAAFSAGTLTVNLMIACAVKILFSTTLTGLIWCIGYIGYNHFKGRRIRTGISSIRSMIRMIMRKRGVCRDSACAGIL